MTTVTLATLMQARDESLAIRRARPAWLSRAIARVRQVALTTVTARITVAALLLAGFVTRHGLVLAGLSAFVIAAALAAPIAGWVVAGAALLFLEVRRR